jgi:hypothetical protein
MIALLCFLLSRIPPFQLFDKSSSTPLCYRALRSCNSDITSLSPSLVDVENPESFVITDATGRRSRVSCFEDEAGFIDLPQGSREDVAIDELRADVDGSRTTPEG